MAAMARGIRVDANGFYVNPLNMCRVCLCDKQQVYIDVTGPDEPNLIQYISEYYKVNIKVNDNDYGKSTKLCQCCMEFIDIWRGHVERAAACQLVVDIFAEKRYMSTIAAAKNAKTAKTAEVATTVAIAETAAATEIVAAAATTSLTVNKKSSLASNKKKKTTSSDNNIKKRSKRRKSSMSITEHEIPSTSTSSDMFQSPSESTQYESNFSPSSNSMDSIPLVSTSTEIAFASTSTEIAFASTSTEIPFASTSTELIPLASTSTEITPSYTINEVSPSGANPIWYSMADEITDDVPLPEILPRSNSYKSEYVCIFCTYQHEEVSLNVYKHIIFCSKHDKPYACLIENCHSVFPNKDVFISHYRTHLNLNSTTFLCRHCFGVLTCWRRTGHKHQNLSDLFKCCSLTFPSMTGLVLHKLINHSAIVVSSNGRSRILQKPNMSIKKTELDDVKVDLDVSDKVSSNEIVKDNGSYKCYCCPIYFTTVLEFINHSKIRHKNLITLKETGIKLCPLCEHSYFIEQFSEHIEKCTDTLKVGEKSLNYYGCIYCKFIFTDITAREIRNHVLYCKSFKLVIVNNKLHHKCNNCTFTSTNDELCLEHANSNCIYLQLKVRYAMGPDEKKKVIDRMEFIKQNTQQQENENYEEMSCLPNTVCDVSRQKLLKFYSYYCNNCKNHFFSKIVFLKHLTLTGSYCRSQSSIYCQKCVTDFETLDDYRGHLPSMPEASPIITIKQEILDQNNDEDDNIIMDEVHTNRNYCDVKVFEINNGTFFQKQEPSNFDDTGDMQYQEQDQEVSNIDLNNSFACQEMELSNDIYMQCEVEDKPDLSQLLVGNVE